MAEPAPIHPVEKLHDITPPEKIIESLSTRTKDPIDLSLRASDPLRTHPEEPAEILPLTWDEVIPSATEIKTIVAQAAIWVGSLALFTGMCVLTLQMLSKQPTRLPLEGSPDMGVSATIPIVSPRPQAPIRHPAAVVPRVSAAPVASRPTIVSEPARPIPENLTARFFSPSSLELNWDGVGEGYRYRLYSALKPTMADAQPETDMFIITSHFAWEPRRVASAMWLAVTSIDPQGRESRMSQPLYIRLR